MTQENRKIVLKVLCAMLPYGFTIHRYSDNRDIIIIESNGIDAFAHFLEYSEGEDFKPYLRPMSSMTEEERADMGEAIEKDCISPYGEIKSSGVDNLLLCTVKGSSNLIDWLNKHHFDYRGLIKMGLALEAPEGMYNLKD